MTEDRLLTSKAAAHVLGINERTLANWRNLGKGPPYVKKGKYVHYWMSDIVKWANKDKVYPEGND